MIVSQLTGGVGNQLFQYACAKSLALRSKEDLFLDISSFSWDTLRDFGLNSFLIPLKIATDVDIAYVKDSTPLILDRFYYRFSRKELPYFRSSIIQEPSFLYDTNFLKYRDKNVYLRGYWQSEKYFNSIRTTLLKELSIDESTASVMYKEQRDLIQKYPDSISIHVRRGDYVTNTETQAYHGSCDLSYYQEAMQLIQQSVDSPTYFVFSDDKEFVRAMFGAEKNVFFIENIPSDYEELILMSLCKHNIIANSSFSWWGAWLNQHEAKKVIAPKRWFADSAMQNLTSDLLPTNWIKI